uniref:Uncharacterized protein n=1 Tax=Cajanus cajan TaxID=3821 RepID=A0A151SRM6_CAJCA|nr:hypothetical protein KK1_003740 [Cajanus cajan]
MSSNIDKANGTTDLVNKILNLWSISDATDFSMMMWSIWTSRNNLLWKDMPWNISEIVHRALTPDTIGLWLTSGLLMLEVLLVPPRLPNGLPHPMVHTSAILPHSLTLMRIHSELVSALETAWVPLWVHAPSRSLVFLLPVLEMLLLSYKPSFWLWNFNMRPSSSNLVAAELKVFSFIPT